LSSDEGLTFVRAFSTVPILSGLFTFWAEWYSVKGCVWPFYKRVCSTFCGDYYAFFHPYNLIIHFLFNSFHSVANWQICTGRRWYYFVLIFSVIAWCYKMMYIWICLLARVLLCRIVLLISLVLNSDLILCICS